MARTFHVNPSTGEPGECRAHIAPCPFGGEAEHHDTALAARKAYEAGQSTFAVKRPSMKHLDAEGLKVALFEESDFAGPSLLTLQAAASFAEELHAEQIRKADVQGRTNTPYVEHPLRNALRLVRLGVRDQDLLVASLLHDTVEDCAKRFVDRYHPEQSYSPIEAREALADHIRRHFGERAYRIVLGVTNPYVSPADERVRSMEEKHAGYQKQVKAEIDSSPTIFMVKLMDYLDNAGSLHHSLDHEVPRAAKQARKYEPLIPDFIGALDAHAAVLERDQGLTSSSRESLREKLERTGERLRELINKS